jgi:hypothetical protein
MGNSREDKIGLAGKFTVLGDHGCSLATLPWQHRPPHPQNSPFPAHAQMCKFNRQHKGMMGTQRGGAADFEVILHRPRGRRPFKFTY